MADQKDKGKGKPKSGEGDSSSAGWTLAFGLIVALALIYEGFLYLQVLFGYRDSITGNIDSHKAETFRISITHYLLNFEAIALFACIMFIIGIIYIKFRLYEMKRLDKVREKVREISEKKISEKPEPNRKWLKVMEHVNSPNSSDWRLAILEADILLNEVLEKMGYKGVTIGDKLKTIERSDFSNLDAAWEAHKTRNSIAHEGSDFRVNQREAQKTIALYEKVFKEFYFI